MGSIVVVVVVENANEQQKGENKLKLLPRDNPAQLGTENVNYPQPYT